MILISHRGNLNGPNPRLENKPSYIQQAIDKGYNVEVDVWYDNGWYFGHDKPQYKALKNFLFCHPFLWIHCKNAEALTKFSIKRYNSISSQRYFWHETDTHALVSNGYLWTFPGKPLTEMSIAVKPEICSYTKQQLKQCLGLCSDYIEQYKTL